MELPASYPTHGAGSALPPSALRSQYNPNASEGNYDEPTDESAAVNAHLENWAEAEHQRRKSVRQARRAEALEEVTNLGPMRRMSSRRRPQHAEQAPATEAPAASHAQPNAGSSGLAPPPMASAGTMASPLAPSPLSGRPDMGAASPRAGEHWEIDMTRKAQMGQRLRPGSNLGPNGGGPAPSESNKPHPTGKRPIVTAGPAPVREMWAKEAAETPSNDSELTPEEQAHKEEIKEEFAQEDKRKKRGFWLTDLLCCNFGSNRDDEQAAKTNPNE